MVLGVYLLPVLVAAIAGFVIGFLWHGPLFGKVWMKMMGITQKQMKEAQMKNMLPQMAAAFVQQLVLSYVIALFAGALGVASAMDAVQLAFWLWLGFIVTTHLNGVLWENRKLELYLFNLSYYAALFLAITLIVGLWQ